MMILITGALTAEHKMFCAVFDQIDQVLPQLSSLAQAKHLSRLVEGLLLRHAQTEDDLFMLEADHVSGNEAAYQRLHREHQEIDARLTQVRVADKVDRAQALLKATLSASRKHFLHEERTVFPLVERVVRRDTLARLGTVWFLRHHMPVNWTL